MSLKEAVAARRAAEAAALTSSPLPSSSTVAPSHSPGSVVNTLRIEPGGCKRCHLAWPQFVRADYDEKDGQEELVIKFAEDEVVVKGTRMARLFTEVLAARVECLRVTPQADLAALSGGEYVIARIEVRVRSDAG